MPPNTFVAFHGEDPAATLGLPDPVLPGLGLADPVLAGLVLPEPSPAADLPHP